jgi:hypothetical protein
MLFHQSFSGLYASFHETFRLSLRTTPRNPFLLSTRLQSSLLLLQTNISLALKIKQQIAKPIQGDKKKLLQKESRMIEKYKKSVSRLANEMRPRGPGLHDDAPKSATIVKTARSRSFTRSSSGRGLGFPYSIPVKKRHHQKGYDTRMHLCCSRQNACTRPTPRTTHSPRA